MLCRFYLHYLVISQVVLVLPVISLIFNILQILIISYILHLSLPLGLPPLSPSLSLSLR